PSSHIHISKINYISNPYPTILYTFFFYRHATHRDLHSFPTRPLPISSLQKPESVASKLARAVFTNFVLRSTGRKRKALSRLWRIDRKSTRLNSSHVAISYAVFCLKKKKKEQQFTYMNMTSYER